MAVFREDVAGLCRHCARSRGRSPAATRAGRRSGSGHHGQRAAGASISTSRAPIWRLGCSRSCAIGSAACAARRHVTAEVAPTISSRWPRCRRRRKHRLEVMAFRQRLPPPAAASQREMLVLVGVRGLSYEAAAEFCGCEVGTAKSRVHRARMALRAMLLDDEPAPSATWRATISPVRRHGRRPTEHRRGHPRPRHPSRHSSRPARSTSSAARRACGQPQARH